MPRGAAQQMQMHTHLWNSTSRISHSPHLTLPTLPPSVRLLPEGNLVKWQKWHIRVGFNAREGLVLHRVAWEDGGRIRPILYRASLAEMTVPVRVLQLDPNPNPVQLMAQCVIQRVHYWEKV